MAPLCVSAKPACHCQTPGKDLLQCVAIAILLSLANRERRQDSASTCSPHPCCTQRECRSRVSYCTLAGSTPKWMRSPVAACATLALRFSIHPQWSTCLTLAAPIDRPYSAGNERQRKNEKRLRINAFESSTAGFAELDATAHFLAETHYWHA